MKIRHRISLSALLAVAACSGGGLPYDGFVPPPDGAVANSDLAIRPGSDLALLPNADLSIAPNADLSGGGSDGTPTRVACTGNLGNAITTTFGRLDGYLVSLVPPGGSKTCNSDSGHLHLQVKANGSVYDVAVTMIDNNNGDVFYAEKDHAPPGMAWQEGWHPGVMNDYPTLGIHTSDFTAIPEAQLVQTVEAQLASANHVAIYMTGYGPTGGHKVHRNGSGTDGVIVVDPLASTAHLLVFHFASQPAF